MKLVLAIYITLMTATAFAQKGAMAPAAVTADDFTCGKMQGITLSEFKMKLVETCDLNKPFSSSLSTLLNEVNYFYCCQKKK